MIDKQTVDHAFDRARERERLYLTSTGNELELPEWNLRVKELKKRMLLGEITLAEAFFLCDPGTQTNIKSVIRLIGHDEAVQINRQYARFLRTLPEGLPGPRLLLIRQYADFTRRKVLNGQITAETWQALTDQALRRIAQCKYPILNKAERQELSEIYRSISRKLDDGIQNGETTAYQKSWWTAEAALLRQEAEIGAMSIDQMHLKMIASAKTICRSIPVPILRKNDDLSIKVKPVIHRLCDPLPSQEKVQKEKELFALWERYLDDEISSREFILSLFADQNTITKPLILLGYPDFWTVRDRADGMMAAARVWRQADRPLPAKLLEDWIKLLRYCAYSTLITPDQFFRCVDEIESRYKASFDNYKQNRLLTPEQQTIIQAANAAEYTLFESGDITRFEHCLWQWAVKLWIKEARTKIISSDRLAREIDPYKYFRR